MALALFLRKWEGRYRLLLGGRAALFRGRPHTPSGVRPTLSPTPSPFPRPYHTGGADQRSVSSGIAEELRWGRGEGRGCSTEEEVDES
eukprot:2125018-Rhodomonas_salina.1